MLAVDFFNDISLLWGIVIQSGDYKTGPGEGFPPGLEYFWADGEEFHEPIRCSGVEYVDFVMSWVEKLLNDDAVFPLANGNLHMFISLSKCELIAPFN